MITVFFVTIMAINIMIALKHRNSSFFAALLWVIMLLVFSGNIRTGFSDLPHYRERYYSRTSERFFSEIGYTNIANYMFDRGLSFQIFLALIFVISSLLIYYAVRSLNLNYNAFLSMVGLFYLFFSMEVIRYFLAASIAFLGFCLLKDGNLKSRIFYIVFVLISALFHKSLLLLIPFAFFYRKGGLDTGKIKMLLYIMVGIVLILIILNLVTHNSGVYLERFFYLIGDDSISRYKANYYILDQKRVNFGYLYYFAYFGMNLLMSCSVKTIYEQGNISRSDYVEIVYQFNVYSMVYLPFIMISTTFFRYILFGAIATFIAIAELINNEAIFFRWKKMKTIEWQYIEIGIIVWTIIWWHTKINAIGPFEALSQNIFF